MIQLSQAFRPQIRAEIVFGPPMREGNTIVYHMKDTCTGWFYRIRTQEYFLISRMDGTKTLEEIGAEYERTFHRRLSTRSWAQLFSLLEKRSLLLDGADAEKLENLKAAAKLQRNKKMRGTLLWRFPLLSPDRFLTRLLPWVRFAFHPVFVYPSLLLIGLLEVFYLFHMQAARVDFLWGLNHYQSVPLVLLLYGLIALFLAVHELAHGLACKYFGGSIQEMGIGWRLIYPFAYCKIDDVVLFHNRWHRVYTAFAGVFVNLLMVIPFAVLWWLSPEHSFARTVGVLGFFSLNLLVLSNLLPFAPLDGSLMLSYALNIIDLRKHGYTIWLQGVKRIFLRKPGKIIHYQGASKYIYLIYGLLSMITLVMFLGSVLFLLLASLHLTFL